MAEQIDPTSQEGLLERIRATREPPAEPEPEKVEPHKAEKAEPESPETPETDDPQQPEKADEPEVEEVDVETFDQLAEMLEASPEDLYHIKVPLGNMDGEDRFATLGELKDALKDSARAESQGKKVAEERSRFEAERQAHTQSVQAQRQQMQAMLEAAEGLLKTEFEGVRWDDLEAEDPARFAAMKEKYRERREQIEHAKSDFKQRMEQSQREQRETLQKQLGERLQSEQAALLKAFPDWKDPEKASKGRDQILSYLHGAGFASQETGHLLSVFNTDHRFVAMAEKARKYDAEVSKVDAAKKRVLKLKGKVSKPGARQSRSDQSHEVVDKARARLKKSGSIHDGVALLKARREARNR